MVKKRQLQTEEHVITEQDQSSAVGRLEPPQGPPGAGTAAVTYKTCPAWGRRAWGTVLPIGCEHDGHARGTNRAAVDKGKVL